MKKIIFTSLFIVVFLSQTKANADWLCVYPDKKVYFENKDSLVYCIRIDSTLKNNTILYPFSDLHKTDSECYSITSGSWLSKYIVLDDNGNTFFVNGKDQRIFIKNQANLHDTWDAFVTEDIKIKGEITSIDLKPVLGVEDSVKTISFSVLDSTRMPVDDALNQVTVEVSKGFGLVKTVNFYYFEYETDDLVNYYNRLDEFNLIGISEPQLGFQPVRLKEDYFDFQPGDELHINNVFNQFASYSGKREIINRYLSRNDYEDSIVYIYESKIRSIVTQYAEGSSHTDISVSIDTLEQKIDKGLLFDTEPNEPFVDYNITKVMITNTLLPQTSFWDSGLGGDSDAVCFKLIPDAGGIQGIYIPGLGGPYHECSLSMMGDEYCYNLVYYKKGDIEAGTPFTFTGIEKIETTGSMVKIYPNPAEDYITVRFNKNELLDSSILEIYDIYGRKWVSKTLGASGFVDVSFLQSGCYIAKLIQKNKTIAYVKMIKK